jgi:hypothetical protein
LGGSCGFDEFTGWSLGTCNALPAYRCAEGDSCEAADYRTPEVPFGALTGPGGKQSAALGAWLDLHGPAGRTPTMAALEGAVGALKDYQSSHSNQRVAVVFATDGEPTVCDIDLTRIAQIAQDALTSSNLETFVIGVFSPAEQTSAQDSLDKIAAAGGTKAAFIVTTTDTATQQFLNALNDVRGSLPCEYAIPVPKGGQPDFGKVNLDYTPKGQPTEHLGYVPSPSDCAANGGWTYDVDPAQKAPTKIVLCPTSCARLRAGDGGTVDIVLGCKTSTAR